MNLNYLWFIPIIIVYIFLWVMAIKDLLEGEDDLPFTFIGLHIFLIVVITTIIGFNKIL